MSAEQTAPCPHQRKDAVKVSELGVCPPVEECGACGRLLPTWVRPWHAVTLGAGAVVFAGTLAGA